MPNAARAVIIGAMKPTFLLVLLAVWANAEPPHVATFSVVARDPQTGELGVAVQSRFLAVGAVVLACRMG